MMPDQDTIDVLRNALAAKDAALSEITAENERLDASCTALDKYASEMLGRAEAAEAALSEMRAELDLARKALEMCSGALQTVALSEKIPESRTFTFVDKWESLGTVRLGTILDTVNEAIARARALASQDEGEER